MSKAINIFCNFLYFKPKKGHVKSPYHDLRVEDLPEELDYSWKMKHGIIDLRDEDNNAPRFIQRPDTLEFLDNHALILSFMSNGQLRYVRKKFIFTGFIIVTKTIVLVVITLFESG